MHTDKKHGCTRIKRIYRILKEKNLDGLLISNEANVSYLSSFGETESIALISPQGNFFITDFRYQYQAKREISNFNIKTISSFNNRAAPLAVAKIVDKLGLKRIGFESHHLSWEKVSAFKDALNDVEFIPTSNLVERLREIKDKEEIRIIEQAARLSGKALRYLSSIITSGMREKELADTMEYFMRSLGAQRSAFNIIVASGERSAFPHAVSSNKIIKANEVVLVDMGANFKGYNSDLTRVIFLGRITRKLKRIYDIVALAQKKALAKIKVGARIDAVDRAARNYIQQKGLGKFFGHALGHGVGKGIHERPLISPENGERLKAGMVFTIEPRVYIPGVGGIRIEDMVLVTKTGCEVLTK